MPGLSALALEHMMGSITPASSFAMLLATSYWDELRVLVEVCLFFCFFFWFFVFVFVLGVGTWD